MDCTITTNNHARSFLYGYDVPDHVLSDFDHLDDGENSDGFICYRKRYYHVSDFMLSPKGGPFEEWHGYLSDSYFSGVLIKMSEDGETYTIATYIG